MELQQHVAELAGRNHVGGRRGLLPRRRQLRSFHSRRGRCHRRPQRILHRLHALPGRGEPGQLAGVLRVSDADLPAHGPRRRQRQPLRRRQRGGRERAHGHDASIPNAPRCSSPRASIREYRTVLATYLANLHAQVDHAARPEGYLDPDRLKKAIDDQTSVRDRAAARISSAAWKRSRRWAGVQGARSAVRGQLRSDQPGPA